MLLLAFCIQGLPFGVFLGFNGMGGFGADLTDDSGLTSLMIRG